MINYFQPLFSPYLNPKWHFDEFLFRRVLFVPKKEWFVEARLQVTCVPLHAGFFWFLMTNKLLSPTLSFVEASYPNQKNIMSEQRINQELQRLRNDLV